MKVLVHFGFLIVDERGSVNTSLEGTVGVHKGLSVTDMKLTARTLRQLAEHGPVLVWGTESQLGQIRSEDVSVQVLSQEIDHEYLRSMLSVKQTGKYDIAWICDPEMLRGTDIRSPNVKIQMCLLNHFSHPR